MAAATATGDLGPATAAAAAAAAAGGGTCGEESGRQRLTRQLCRLSLAREPPKAHRRAATLWSCAWQAGAT